MKIQKPPYPPRLKPDGFTRRTPWNPKEQVDAVTNRPPQSMWPIKDGKPVFVIDTGNGWSDFTVYSGRVCWFHPARDIDASCVVSPGHPCFGVRNQYGYKNPNKDFVFPFTRAGWRACLNTVSRLWANRAGCLAVESEAAKIRSQAASKKSMEVMLQARSSR